jgi:hypothetical protein
MPSDTYILTVSEAGVSVPSTHASTHITGGSDAIPTATSSTSGLMSAAIFNQHVTNTAKVSNATHTGDVTDASGVLTVNRINGVSLAGLATGILKNTTSTGVPSIAVAADFPTLNQSTTGNAATATTATNLAGGAAGAVPYQTGSGTTALLGAGTAGYVLKSNGSAAPSWAPVDLSAGISGSLPVASGGTGAATFTAGILKANNTSAFITTPAPNGDIVGTNDIQTLTNKTLGTGTTFSNPISVGNGGTGASTFTAGILTANGANAFSTTPAPSGDLVGTTAAQTITNKTFGINTVFSTSITAASGGTGQTSYVIGDILYADTSSSLAKLPDVVAGNVLISGGVGIAPSYGKVGLTTHVSGTLPVANGGTGVTTSTGSGANVLATSPTLVTPILGTPTSGTLTSCTGLPLTTGVTGTLPVARGGTGLSTITGYVKGTGTSPLSTSATIPVADISGILPVANGGTGNNGTAVDALVFDTLAYKTSSPSSDALATGEMRWNTTDKTLDLKLEGDVTLQVGQEQNLYVENESIDDIPNGAAVYISGVATGDIPSVRLATSVNDLANKTLGISTQDILSGDYGYITLTGLVRGLANTDGYTTNGMTAGDEIWLSTDGKWLNTQQSFINSQIKLGHVIQVSSTQGSILVNPRIIAGPSGQRVGGIINSNSTAYLSSSTGATVMNSYTVPATGFRNTGTIIKASYRGRITTAASPANRQITLSIGPSGTPTTVFDSTSFTPSVTSPATLYWTLEATFSRVSNTELDVFVMLHGNGIPTAVLTTQYTNVTGLNLNSTPYLIILTGTSTDSSSTKAIGYDFSTISWDPT